VRIVERDRIDFVLKRDRTSQISAKAYAFGLFAPQDAYGACGKSVTTSIRATIIQDEDV
jgi:hypothetical protein